MNMDQRKPWSQALLCCLALGFSICAQAAPVQLNIQTDARGPRINPAMWGVFFEDINFGADGGLYAELVKNRGFEFPEPLMGWTKLSPGIAKGELSIHDDNPFNWANPHYLRIESYSKVPF